jgi:hypothetical protein
MTEIEEIPINSADAVETELTPPEENQDIKDIPKKGRGRPAGAKNKAKPKPAPATAKPRPKVKQKKPIEYEESESEEEEAPPPRRRVSRSRVAQPMEFAESLDRHALASDVLNILQQQRYERTTAKRNHYASWF